MRLIVKRVMDIVGALAGLVVAFPLMLLTALLIRLNMGSPVIFRQLR
ncbi:MAG: sugar transferase, partial [Candidatus Marinimicrobia bacterium]|nr:sugar transferase [Candidatus Neomarinimicrobiota bacterium]